MNTYIERLVIELSNKCNMKCQFCPHPVYTREQKFMEFDLFQSIIDEIAAYNQANAELKLTDIIIFSGMGEQLLYPKFCEAVNYVASKGLKPHLTTNAVLLTEKKYAQIAEAGIDLFGISFHNLNQESFEYRGSNLSYRRYLDGMLAMADLQVRNQYNCELEISVMYSIPGSVKAAFWNHLPAMHNSRYEYMLLLLDFLKAIYKIIRKHHLPVKSTMGDILSAYENGQISNSTKFFLTDHLSIIFIELQHQVFNTRAKLAGALANKMRLVPKSNAHCYYLRSCPMILSNGDFVPCGAECSGELRLGTVGLNTSLVSILTSKEYTEFARRMSSIQDFDKLHSSCKECLIIKATSNNCLFGP